MELNLEDLKKWQLQIGSLIWLQKDRGEALLWMDSSALWMDERHRKGIIQVIYCQSQ